MKNRCTIACLKLFFKIMAQYNPMKTESRAVLDKILKHYGTKAEMARQFDVSRNCISYWFTRGQVGRDSVLKVASVSELGLTASQIRPDLSW